MIPDYFNYFSPFLSLFGAFFYLRGIIKGETTPNKVGWFIWMLAPMVSSFIILKNGGGISAIPVFMSWIIPAIVLVVSFRIKTKLIFSKLDLICLFFAIIALYLWLKEDNLYWATVFAVVADGLGFIPTIIKSWTNPETEKTGPFITGIISASIALLTLKEYPFHLYGFPMYLIIGNTILVLVIIRKKIFKKV